MPWTFKHASTDQSFEAWILIAKGLLTEERAEEVFQFNDIP